jgi:hypothetical protein
MTSYANALRAVASFYAKRMIKIAGWIGLAVFIALIILTWVLAYYLSNYWWLTLIFILPLGFIGLIVFLIALGLANIVYNQKLSAPQKELVKNYVDKVQSVVEATSYSFSFILFTIAKDLLFHRNLQTLEKFIDDSTSLKRDLDTLANQL